MLRKKVISFLSAYKKKNMFLQFGFGSIILRISLNVWNKNRQMLCCYVTFFKKNGQKKNLLCPDI